jgi:hypothetical protein
MSTSDATAADTVPTSVQEVAEADDDENDEDYEDEEDGEEEEVMFEKKATLLCKEKNEWKVRNRSKHHMRDFAS